MLPVGGKELLYGLLVEILLHYCGVFDVLPLYFFDWRRGLRLFLPLLLWRLGFGMSGPEGWDHSLIVVLFFHSVDSSRVDSA